MYIEIFYYLNKNKFIIKFNYLKFTFLYQSYFLYLNFFFIYLYYKIDNSYKIKIKLIGNFFLVFRRPRPEQSVQEKNARYLFSKFPNLEEVTYLDKISLYCNFFQGTYLIKFYYKFFDLRYVCTLHFFPLLFRKRTRLSRKKIY